MSYRCIAGTVAVAAFVSVAAACSKAENRAPELATKTPDQPINQARTIMGCLRASPGPNTFVLIASETLGATTTATYQLVPKAGIDLQTYAGQDVEVSGTLRSQQTLGTSGKVEDKPTTTGAGTPSIETKSEVTVRTFDVDSVKPTGQTCVGQ